MLRVLIASLVIATVLSENVKLEIVNQNVKIGRNEYDNEMVSVELKKPNEDIKFIAQVRFHLVEGNVHINGHRLEHNNVHHIQMMVQVIDIVNGIKQAAQRKAVELRVLVEDGAVNGVRRLLVEEQFTMIGETDVEQIDVHQLIWESGVRKPTIRVKLSESKIHTKPKEHDHSMFLADEKSIPQAPAHGYGYDSVDDEAAERRHHGNHHHKSHHHHCHHRHHHHENSTYSGRKMHDAKCWYKSLSWKSKILLFSIGFFGLLTAVICCGLCAKRRRARRALVVNAPMDDSIDIEDDENSVKDGKKLDDKKYEFHFEFDNSVVVDDKKCLVEEA